jgi:hypothetical protein
MRQAPWTLVIAGWFVLLPMLLLDGMAFMFIGFVATIEAALMAACFGVISRVTLAAHALQNIYRVYGYSLSVEERMRVVKCLWVREHTVFAMAGIFVATGAMVMVEVLNLVSELQGATFWWAICIMSLQVRSPQRLWPPRVVSRGRAPRQVCLSGTVTMVAFRAALSEESEARAERRAELAGTVRVKTSPLEESLKLVKGER